MLKRLLIALDATPAAREAQSLALRLALAHGAALKGLAIVDPEILIPVEPMPIGGDTYKVHKDAVLIDRARAAASALAQAFTDECRTAHVEAESGAIQGPALATLISACAPHDVVVLGNDTSFGGDPKAPSPLIAGLLNNNPRPLIVSPVNEAPGPATLIAYDASVPAMRALQLFAALGLRKANEAVVVSIGADAAAAKTMAEEGETFLRERGYKAVARPLAGGKNPIDTLIAAAKSANAGMIVAGAYGHRGWREWLLGTTTEALVAQSPVPLFIHH